MCDRVTLSGALTRPADSNEIGTFIADRLAPLVSLYTATDNIGVRQLALWDLCAPTAPPVLTHTHTWPRLWNRLYPLTRTVSQC